MNEAGARFSLGRSQTAPRSDDGEDDGIALPFAPEVGTATPIDGGFATGALELVGKVTSAVVVVLSRGLLAGKKIDLGAVHGDVPPPQVVGQGNGIVVAVPDGAPNGTIVRLARIDDPAHAAHVKWGAQIPEPSDDSDAFALEVGDKVGILAWDEWDAKGEHGIIRAVTFAPEDVAKTSAPIVLSDGHDDAEGPSLVPRAGGFWAAWIVNTKRAPDPKDRAQPSDTAEPVDMGPRYVALAPLDDSGKPSGAPVAVTPKDGHATGFDLATAGDGSALVTWRDDATSPGTSGGTVRLVLVRAGGSIEPRPLADDDVGVGTPSLLADSAPVGDTRGWLSLTNEADADRLVALDAEGRTLDLLGVESAVGVGTPIAVHGGQLLVAHPRGRGLELEVLTCAKGSNAPPPEPAPSPPDSSEPVINPAQ